MIGFSYVYLYPRLLGYDKQMLMVAQVMYLIAGASIAGILLRVALVWSTILSAAAYIAMILFEQEFRFVSLAGFTGRARLLSSCSRISRTSRTIGCGNWSLT